MATMTIFKPSTDDFGQLTMHATILGEQTFGGLSEETRRSHVNFLIAVTFFITLIIGGTGLYSLDQALFSHTQTQVGTASHFAVDYD